MSKENENTESICTKSDLYVTNSAVTLPDLMVTEEPLFDDKKPKPKSNAPKI